MELISSLLLDGRSPALVTPPLELAILRGGHFSRSVKRILHRKSARAAIIQLKKRKLWQHLFARKI